LTDVGWAGVLNKMEDFPWARSIFDKRIKGSRRDIESAIDLKLTGNTDARDKIASFLRTLRDPRQQVHVSEGIFFAEDYAPRVLSENGRILAIEFLRRTGGSTTAAAPAKKAKSKSSILKSQLDIQLGGK